jgi:CBS domain-containing protein
MMARSDVYRDPMPRHHCTVADVMTAPVVTADRLTPYQEIIRLLAEHQISGLPVIEMGWQVVGVISESDLLAAEDTAARQARREPTIGQRMRFRRPGRPRLTAGELMTTPPITISPEVTVPAAVRVMNMHHLSRLPVTGTDDTLIGIVTRRDLLSVFLRPDADIVREVRQLLEHSLINKPVGIAVTVRHGVVTLNSGTVSVPGRSQDVQTRQDRLPLAIQRLIWDIDGVVTVVNRLSHTRGAKPAGTA